MCGNGASMKLMDAQSTTAVLAISMGPSTGQMESRSAITERMRSTGAATNGWVMYGSAKWLPELLPALQMARVIVTHTRYVHQYRGQVSHWEVQAVFVVQRQKDPQVIPNLVSIGD